MILKIPIRILPTVACQQVGQHRRNGQVYRNIQPTKTESRRYRKSELTKSEIESVIKKKNSLQTKVQDWMASLGNSTKHIEKSLHQNISNSSKTLKGREHSQSHSMKPPAPYTKTRRRHYKKKKDHRSISLMKLDAKSSTKY